MMWLFIKQQYLAMFLVKKGYKYLIGNKMMKKSNHYILWLHISAHAKNCDETKCVFFKADGELLEKEKSNLV